jgi:GMP synthase-like glutamine amidotransferase
MDPWFRDRGHELTQIALCQGHALPLEESFDLLVIGGGGMFPTDEYHYPWLRRGIELIRAAVLSGRYVVGICLGAQLLGHAFGGQIRKNNEIEIGWHPIQLSPEGESHPFMRELPTEFLAFHWHQDVVSVPQGATLLASSAACPNQAFAIGNRALGIQFHPEITERKAKSLAVIDPPLNDGSYVQSEETIFSEVKNFINQTAILNLILRNLLDT